MSRGYFLGFLVFINILNFVDRQLISSFGPTIVEDLELSNLEFGLITGFAFTIFYSVAGLIMGSLVDTGNRPKILAIGLTLWSVFTALTGRAQSFIGMALPRMFIGVGESIQTPSSISMLSERFPAERMGMASGIYYLGVPLGVGVSLLIVAYLGPTLGWRNCFYLMGIIGVLSALVLYLSVKESPKRLEKIENRKTQKVKRGVEMMAIAKDLFATLKVNPSLRWTIIGGVITHFILGASQFDQLWLVNEVGFDRTTIALYSGYIFIVFGMMGNVFGGVGSDWFAKKFNKSRPLFLAIVQLVIVPITLFYRLSDMDSIMIWVGLAAGAFGLGTLYGPTFSTVQELASEKSKATAVAFYILLLNLVGLGLGSLMIGVMSDMMIANGVQNPLTISLAVITLISGLAAPAFYIAHRTYSKAVATA